MASPSGRFRQTISFIMLTGRSASGAPTFGVVGSARARVEPVQKTIRDSKGAEHLSSHVIHTEAELGLSHRVWVPGTNTADFNQARRIARIDEHVDGEGVVRFRSVWL